MLKQNDIKKLADNVSLHLLSHLDTIAPNAQKIVEIGRTTDNTSLELKELFPEASLQQIHYADLERLDEGSVDLIVINLLALPLTDLSELLSDARTALADDGLFIFSVLDARTTDSVHAYWKELLDHDSIAKLFGSLEIFYSQESEAQIQAPSELGGKATVSIYYLSCREFPTEKIDLIREARSEAREAAEYEAAEYEQESEAEERGEEQEESEIETETPEAAESAEEVEGEQEAPEAQESEQETEQETESESEEEQEAPELEPEEAAEREEKQEQEAQEEDDEEDKVEEHLEHEHVEQAETEQHEEPEDEEKEQEKQEFAAPTPKPEPTASEKPHKELKDDEQDEALLGSQHLLGELARDKAELSHHAEQLEQHHQVLQASGQKLAEHHANTLGILAQLNQTSEPEAKQALIAHLAAAHQEHKQALHEYKNLQSEHQQKFTSFFSAHTQSMASKAAPEQKYEQLAQKHRDLLESQQQNIDQHQALLSQCEQFMPKP